MTAPTADTRNLLLSVPHRNNVIEPDIDRPRSRHELHELRAIGGVDVGDRSLFALRYAFEIELQLDLLLVHRCCFELVVVIARNRLISFFGHSAPPRHPLRKESSSARRTS